MQVKVLMLELENSSESILRLEGLFKLGMLG